MVVYLVFYFLLVLHAALSMMLWDAAATAAAHDDGIFKQQLKTDEKDWGRGRLLLSLSFITEKSLLLVGVIRAEGLPALDHHRTSDPFVKV